MENNNENSKKNSLLTSIMGTFIACFVAVLLANLVTLFIVYKYVSNNCQAQLVTKVLDEIDENVKKKHPLLVSQIVDEIDEAIKKKYPILSTTLNFAEKYSNSISNSFKELDNRLGKGLAKVAFVNKNELKINENRENNLVTKLMNNGKTALYDSDFENLIEEDEFPVFIDKIIKFDETLGKDIRIACLTSFLDLALPKLCLMYKSYLNARKCQIEKSRLTWALTLYNHANKDNQLKENEIDTLIKTGYWKSPENKECSYYVDNGLIFCKKHGSIKQPKNTYGSEQIIALTDSEKKEIINFNFEYSKKSCLTNQRVLLGAVEMYNMDKPIMMKNLNIDPLIKDRYLKEIPKCPSDGIYSSLGDLCDDGKITCSVHGSLDTKW